MSAVKKRWGILAAALLLCSVFALTAVPDSAFAAGDEIIVWTSEQTSADSAQALKGELEARFGVKLNFVYFSPAEADTKINLAIASGQKWDMIMESNLGRFNDFASRGLLKDITESVKTDYPNIYENLPDYAQSDMVWQDGKIYGLPIIDFVNLPSIMVRKDILNNEKINMGYLVDEQQGRITWDQLEELMHKVTTVRDIKIQDGRVTKTIPRMYGATEGMTSHSSLFQPWSEASYSIPWVSTGDQEAYSHHIATSPQVVAYLAVWRYWFQNGYLNPSYFSMPSSESLNTFVSGESPVRFSALTQDYIDPKVRDRVAYLYPPTGAMGGGSAMILSGFSKWIFNKDMDEAKYQKIMRMISYMATQEGYDRCNYGVEGANYELQSDGAVKFIGNQFWGLSFYRSILLKRVDTYMQGIPNLERQIMEFKAGEYPIEFAGVLSSSAFYSEMLANDYFKDRRDPAVNKYMLTEFAKFVTTDEPLENWQKVRLQYKSMIGDFGTDNYASAVKFGLLDELDEPDVARQVFAHFNDLKSYAGENYDLFKTVIERVGGDPEKVMSSMSYERNGEREWEYTGPLKTEADVNTFQKSLVTLFTLIGIIIALFILALFLTRKKKDREG